MINFDFLEEGLGLVSGPHFACDFTDFAKCFLCYILLTDQISLSDCIFLLRYWLIYGLYVIICFPVCDINSEINLSSLNQAEGLSEPRIALECAYKSFI